MPHRNRSPRNRRAGIAIRARGKRDAEPLPLLDSPYGHFDREGVPVRLRLERVALIDAME